MYCPYCGTSNRDEQEFCQKCRKAIKIYKGAPKISKFRQPQLKERTPLTETYFRKQLNNVGSIVGIGLLAAIPTGIVFGLISQAFYLILLFPATMGYIIAIGAKKGVRIARLPFFLIVMISIILSISTYPAMFFVNYEFFKHEMASMMDAQIIRELGIEPGQQMEEFRRVRSTKQYRELRKAFLNDSLKAQTGHSGFIGYLISRVQGGDEIGLVISDRTANVGAHGTVILWIVEMIIIAVVIGRKLTRYCSVF